MLVAAGTTHIQAPELAHYAELCARPRPKGRPASDSHICSVVITSNRGFEAWGEILGDAMVTAALIDRLVHHATMVTLKGKSYRLRERGTAPASAARPTPFQNRPPSRTSRRRHLTPLAYGSLREKPPQPSTGLVSTGAWCTFRFLKLAPFWAPVDTLVADDVVCGRWGGGDR